MHQFSVNENPPVSMTFEKRDASYPGDFDMDVFMKKIEKMHFFGIIEFDF